MPALRLLIPFITGIALYIETSAVDLLHLYLSLILMLTAVGIIIYVNSLTSAVTVYKWRYANGIAILVSMVSLGYILTFLHTDTNDPHHIAHTKDDLSESAAIYSGLVADPPVIREKTVSVLIALDKATQNDSSIYLKGNVVASVVKDDSSVCIKYGDKIVFSAIVVPYERPKNPGQFDYKNYQSLHHIYHRAYVQNGSWHISAHNQGSLLLNGIYKIRSYFLSLITSSVKGPDELAVATAIMLGYRDYVTDDVTQAYAGSGVLHVLSVSGLHVAVLYFVLNILLGWMDRKPKLKVVKGIAVIFIMLFYAGLTGLSPPVLRSVWMFTLLSLARLLDRDISMYNVLSVSCLVLLIWDPYFIADAGFQLSYIAVAGIVFLYPQLHVLLPHASLSFGKPFTFLSVVLNYLYDFVWGLICVSIAAQIATFPVSLYYFHTFPNFFLVSNLLVIPLSNFVLISGMILFAVGSYHWLFIYSGWIFDHLLITLNKVVFNIDRLPLALSRGLIVSMSEMILFYIVIGMVCWFVYDRRAKILLSILLLILVLCGAFTYSNIQKDHIQTLTVYNITGQKAISFIIHRRVYYDFDSALSHNEISIRNNIRTHWWQCGVENEINLDSFPLGYALPYGKLYSVYNKKIVVIDRNIEPANIAKIQTDIVILSHNAANSITEIKQRVDFQKIVFDTSNKPSHIKHWIEDCERLGIKYHDCRDRAFVMDL